MTDTRSEHTPYEVVHIDGKTFPYSIFDCKGYNICNDLDKERAEFIVTACNAHAGLVEALEFSRQIIEKALRCESNPAWTFIPLKYELTHAKSLNDEALAQAEEAGRDEPN